MHLSNPASCVSDDCLELLSWTLDTEVDIAKSCLYHLSMKIFLISKRRRGPDIHIEGVYHHHHWRKLKNETKSSEAPVLMIDVPFMLEPYSRPCATGRRGEALFNKVKVKGRKVEEMRSDSVHAIPLNHPQQNEYTSEARDQDNLFSGDKSAGLMGRSGDVLGFEVHQ